MKKIILSLRNAVMVPVFIAIILIVSTFIIIWNIDYNRMVEIQSENSLRSVNDNLNTKLNNFFLEPTRLGELLSQELRREQITLEPSMEIVRGFIESYANILKD
jgi:hypothetical protein